MCQIKKLWAGFNQQWGLDITHISHCMQKIKTITQYFSHIFQSNLGMTWHAWPDLTNGKITLQFPWMPNCIQKLQDNNSIEMLVIRYFGALWAYLGILQTHLQCYDQFEMSIDVQLDAKNQMDTQIFVIYCFLFVTSTCPWCSQRLKSHWNTKSPFPLPPILKCRTTKPPPNNPTSFHWLKAFSRWWVYIVLLKE